MNEVYTKALTEVDEIINHLDIATLEKIPISFRKFVKTTKNQDYRFEYKDKLPLTEQGLSDEAKAIISLMYRNYMCSKEEKQRLAEKDKKALEIKRQKEQEKYNVDNIIKEKQKEMQGAKAQLPTVIKKEGFFRRILNGIKNFFKEEEKMTNEKEEILEKLEDEEITIFEVGYKLREDPEFVLAATKLSSSNFQMISPKLRSDENFMKKIVEIDGRLIGHATSELRDNEELVEIAVKNSGYALQYVSSRLRNDPKIVEEAVRKDGCALHYARKGLKDNDKIVKTAIEQNGTAIQYASDRLKQDEEMAKIAVKRDGVALGYIDEKLKKNKEIVLLAVKKCGSAITYADTKLKSDIEVVTQAAIQNEDILYWSIGKEIKDNPELMEQIRETVKQEREAKNRQIQEIDSQVTPEQRKMALSEIAKMRKLMIKSNDKKIQMDKTENFETKPINEFLDKDEEER